MLKCPYCGSSNITALSPLGVSKPRKLYRYEFAQHCNKCDRNFNMQSRLLAKKVNPSVILFAQQIPTSGELKQQFISK